MKNLHSYNLTKPITEKTLDKNAHLFHSKDWGLISYYQSLSEIFMQKHKDKLNWDYISSQQNMSEGFIRKHFDRIDFNRLVFNPKIKPGLSKKIYDEVSLLKEII